jgi:lipopolysaccharide transport system permease protein
MLRAATDNAVSHYLREVWAYRYFWMTLVHIDLRQRYKRSVLGMGWSLLHPIAMTTVLCFCFYQIFNIDLKEYVPFLFTGMAFWTFVTGVTTDGAQAFYQAQGFIKSERVPLAVYPLRVVLGILIHFGISLGLTLVIALAFKGSLSPLPLLSLAPSVVLLACFGWSVAVLMAFACVHFPDVQQLSTIGLQMLFYLTPVMYPPEMMNIRGLGAILRYNPLGYFVELLRLPIINGAVPSVEAFAITGALTLGMMLTAMFVLSRCEKRLIFALL